MGGSDKTRRVMWTWDGEGDVGRYRFSLLSGGGVVVSQTVSGSLARWCFGTSPHARAVLVSPRLARALAARLGLVETGQLADAWVGMYGDIDRLRCAALRAERAVRPAEGHR